MLRFATQSAPNAQIDEPPNVVVTGSNGTNLASANTYGSGHVLTYTFTANSVATMIGFSSYDGSWTPCFLDNVTVQAGQYSNPGKYSVTVTAQYNVQGGNSPFQDEGLPLTQTLQANARIDSVGRVYFAWFSPTPNCYYALGLIQDDGTLIVNGSSVQGIVTTNGGSISFSVPVIPGLEFQDLFAAATTGTQTYILTRTSN